MLQKNQQLGHYRIVRLIGRGGMGEVYLAEDLKIPRQVAIKVVQSEASLFQDEKGQEEAARLFQREMLAITMLDHPFILTLFEVGEETEDQTTLSYMVMPYRAEGALPQWLRQQNKPYPLPISLVAHFISQAADALQHAHDKQIIHLDVKPSNFLVRERRDHPERPDILLADFGIAKITNSTRSSIKGGNTSSHGTLEYTAPEQWNGTPVASSDQYALAMMAYEFLTGRIPFQGNMPQMIYQQIHIMPDAPSKSNAALNPAIDAVLLRALAKKPEERFPTIADFGRAFQHAANYADLRTTLTLNNTEATTGLSRTMFLPGKRQIMVTIPPGVREGQVIRVEGEGEAYYEGGPRGVLLLSMAIKEVSGGTGPITPIIPLMPITPERLDEELPHIAPPPPVEAERAAFSPPIAPTRPADNIPPLPDGRYGFNKPPHDGHIAPTVAAKATVAEKTSGSKSGSSRRTIMLAVIALVIILASIFGFASYQNHVYQVNVAATASADLATSQADDATATAQANATATIVAVVNANPYPSYLPGNGTLALIDPLSSAYQWSSGSDTSFGGSCQFSNGALHISQDQPHKIYFCSGTRSFSNFAFEVKMTIINGDCGGIVFRENASLSRDYIFELCQNGSYTLYKYTNSNTSTILVSGSASSTMNTGTGQTNTIAILANGTSLGLYVNEQKIDSANDGDYVQGIIGLTATDNSNTVEVAYSIARVWTL